MFTSDNGELPSSQLKTNLFQPGYPSLLEMSWAQKFSIRLRCTTNIILNLTFSLNF